MVRAIVGNPDCLNDFLELAKDAEAEFATCKIGHKRNLFSFLWRLLWSKQVNQDVHCD